LRDPRALLIAGPMAAGKTSLAARIERLPVASEGDAA